MNLKRINIVKSDREWKTTGARTKLHFMMAEEDVGGKIMGRSSCGIYTIFYKTGIFTKITLPRCKRCCLAVGITFGRSAPLFDTTCEEI